MDFLNEYIVQVILGICLVVGYIIKKWIPDLNNKYIPTIVTLLGVFLSIWVNDFAITPAIVLSGLVTGAASTGLHQVFAQYIEKHN